MLIVFLIVAVIPISYAVTLSLKKIWIKHLMLEALENKSLQVIKTNVSLVKWVEEDEVIIEGKYFDVRTFTVSGKTIVLTGLYDDKEEALALQIEKCYNLDNNTTSSGQMHALIMLFQPLILHENYSLQEKKISETLLSFFISPENLLHRQRFVDTPPPKILC